MGLPVSSVLPQARTSTGTDPVPAPLDRRRHLGLTLGCYVLEGGYFLPVPRLHFDSGACRLPESPPVGLQCLGVIFPVSGNAVKH